MMKEKLNVSASNIVNVCIDNIDGVERSGRFYCYYSKDPIFFRSIHELFRYMERFMNELNFPQSSTELRTYEDKQQKPANEKRISFTEVSNREQILERYQTLRSSIHRWYRYYNLHNRWMPDHGYSSWLILCKPQKNKQIIIRDCL